MDIKDIFVFDTHGHKEKTIPLLLKLINPSTPFDVRLKDFYKYGLNGAVISSLGDPNSFRFWKIDSYKYVLKQLSKIKADLPQDSILIKSPEDFKDKISSNFKAFLLGIEGADFLQNDMKRLEYVYSKGVRLLTLVHFSNNCVGYRCMDFKGKEEDPSKGLTIFGEELVKRMNEIGMVIDISHCNEKTAFNVVELSKKPVISSHTGPRALQDFPRYSSDELLISIAKNGGVIGLWPFRKGDIGISDFDHFVKYAKYLVKLVGIDHISMGTDINGVLSNMKGYKNIVDYYKIIDAFENSGFSKEDIIKIMSSNFFRVLSESLSPL